MQTSEQCLACFRKQALYTVGLCTDRCSLQKQILAQVEHYLASLDFSLSPPENAVPLYNLISEQGGCPDPFARHKEESNAFALGLWVESRQKVAGSAEPLLTALKFAVAGNIIDYGSHQEFNAAEALAGCHAREFAVNDFPSFAAALDNAATILYLGDNCGELVFDSILIEVLAGMGKEITLAVKERAIINDALVTDAVACGLDRLCRVVSNGTGCPGTPLAGCSADFLEIFHAADLIISKGQGNFETLSDAGGPLFYLLTVKCPVVAGHISDLLVQDGRRVSSLETGDMVLLHRMQ